jgi:hypothetical protein
MELAQTAVKGPRQEIIKVKVVTSDRRPGRLDVLIVLYLRSHLVKYSIGLVIACFECRPLIYCSVRLFVC